MSAAEPPQTFAKIIDLDVKREFISAEDNQLIARVTFENNSDLVHSAQVVFRGYVRPDSSSKKKSEKKVKSEKNSMSARRTSQQEFVDLQQSRAKREQKEEEKAETPKSPSKSDSGKKDAKDLKRKDSKRKDSKVKTTTEEEKKSETQQILYEFLHEQIWLVLDKKGRTTQEAFVDVWLPRFPPSGPIHEGGPLVEYSCRVTVDPWYENHHVEKTFSVVRTLILKQPHEAAYANIMKVSRCMDHGGSKHSKKCEPLNGEIWTDKGAYVPGEKITVRWSLAYQKKVIKPTVSLIRTIKQRNPDPGEPQHMDDHVETIATNEPKNEKDKNPTAKGESKSKKERPDTTAVAGKEGNSVTLKVPKQTPVSIAMTIYNVMAVQYSVRFEAKVEGRKEPVEFILPVLVCTEQIQGRQGKMPKNTEDKLYRRAVDVDDDSADDDDVDSEIDDFPDSEARKRDEFSFEVQSLKVATRESGQLHDAYAEVNLFLNSREPRSLHSLRLMFTGEVRANSIWYEFLRYKALVSNNQTSAMSPGEHILKVALPFHNTQYDTNILIPTLDDDVRYKVRVTMESWEKNSIQRVEDIVVDRFVDTWSKEEFTRNYEEEMGAWGIRMRQRCFQRGKWAYAKVLGEELIGCKLRLLQQRRLRIPGLREDQSHLTEKIVTEFDYSEEQDPWPEELFLKIPEEIPPSLEISYWNVLVLSYVLVILPRGEDGHEHTHNIPIWIGVTDDQLKPPDDPTNGGAGGPNNPNKRNRMVSQESLPEFEVFRPEDEEVKEQPWWVERYNQDMYS